MPGQTRLHYKRPLKGRLSPETRARMSANASGANNSFYGRTHSTESIAKIRASHKGTPRPTVKGKQRPPEVRARIAAALKGRKRPNAKGHPNTTLKSVPRSEAVRHKISETLKRRGRTPEHVAALNAVRPRGPTHPFFGKSLSPLTRHRISAALRGKPRLTLRGKKLSVEHRAALSAGQTRRLARVRQNLRDAFRARGLQVSYDDRAPGYVAATPQMPDSAVLQRERKQVVRAALAGLALREKRVVNAVFFEGKPMDEVAKAEGLTRGETETLLSVVLAKLRQQPRLRAVMG